MGGNSSPQYPILCSSKEYLLFHYPIPVQPSICSNSDGRLLIITLEPRCKRMRVSLGNQFHEPYNRILMNRTRRGIRPETGQEQSGFIKDTSKINAIFIIRLSQINKNREECALMFYRLRKSTWQDTHRDLFTRLRRQIYLKNTNTERKSPL